MPELCRFRGIVIVMYLNEDHAVAHFHARYARFRASLGLDGQLLAGDLPAAQLRLVRRWAALHQAELADNWERVRRHQARKKIDPLA